jgi:hypothetical protein
MERQRNPGSVFEPFDGSHIPLRLYGLHSFVVAVLDPAIHGFAKQPASNTATHAREG